MEGLRDEFSRRAAEQQVHYESIIRSLQDRITTFHIHQHAAASSGNGDRDASLSPVRPSQQPRQEEEEEERPPRPVGRWVERQAEEDEDQQEGKEDQRPAAVRGHGPHPP